MVKDLKIIKFASELSVLGTSAMGRMTSWLTQDLISIVAPVSCHYATASMFLVVVFCFFKNGKQTSKQKVIKYLIEERNFGNKMQFFILTATGQLEEFI